MFLLKQKMIKAEVQLTLFLSYLMRKQINRQQFVVQYTNFTIQDRKWKVLKPLVYITLVYITIKTVID